MDVASGPHTRGAMLLLRSKGHSLSRISRLLSLSRNSSVPTFVRQVPLFNEQQGEKE